MNGTRTLAVFDTGAARTTVTPHAARAAGVTIESEGVTANGTVGGLGSRRVKSYSAVFPKLTVGDETINNARLTIADMFGWDKRVPLGSHIPVDNSGDDLPNMLIGADFLSAHRVFVARSQGKIYFSYQGGPIFEDRKTPHAPEEAPPPTQATPSSPVNH